MRISLVAGLYIHPEVPGASAGKAAPSASIVTSERSLKELSGISGR